jgi:hypothetical protein
MSRRFDLAPQRSVLSAVAVAALMVLSLAPGGPGVADVRAAGSVNLDQWATKAPAWQNGNLNGNNTRYPEGGIVPFRLAIEGLSAGAHTIRIQYDFTAGGHKAYDFLARYSGWVSPSLCGVGGGGVLSSCPSLGGSSSAAFPSDGFSTDGLSVRGAEDYSGVSRRLTIWGGTITSISGPNHAGSTSGNSTAEFVVKFTSTKAAVLLAWGGHLAQSRYWNMAAGGPRDGAGEVSGAPWHMRTLQLDGSGNRNQDRSIQPSAIVGELPPFALAPPTPRPPTTRAIVTPPPTNGGGGGGGVPVDPPVPTAPATSTAAIPDSPARGVRWEVVALLALLASGGFATALVRVRGPNRRD